MAEETKSGIKMEEETKPLKKLCEKLEEAITSEFNKGIEQIDVEEMGKAVDMLKDLYEAKKYMLEGCYFKSVVEAMEEYGEDEGMEDDGRRGYRGQRRDSRGRYMSRRSGRRGYESPMMMDDDWEEMQHMRDMDRVGSGRMYYSGGGSGSSSGGMSSGNQSGNSGMSGGMSGGNREYSESNNRDYREGRSGQSRRGYMEAKENHKGNSPQEKQEKMKELEKYMQELSGDITEMINDASPEEKNLLKAKMQTLIQKIG